MRKAMKLLEGRMIASGMECTPQILEKFQRYGELLIEWNKKMNLTRIVEPEDIAMKHFYDSLLFLHFVNVPQNAKLIDVGTGAGFPGIPILIVRPDVRMTLLDSLKKRLTFLETVLGELGLEAETLHARGEEAGRNPQYREQFDLVTARAVAAMPVLSEYCIPFAKVGGTFAAMKGPGFAQECEEAKKAITLLGGKLETAEQYSLTEDNTRTIVKVKKMSQTSAKYPRISAKIAKMPL